MPPPHEKKPLNSHQIQLLKEWIASGANYDVHWAFTPPTKPATARTNNDSGKENAQPAGDAADHPMDVLVAKQLEKHGLQPSPPAASFALCRRIYLDIIGLPPRQIN